MAHDDYKIDSHKLMLHPRRVADWLEGKKIAPIYLELSPSDTCNHHCTFCSVDYIQSQHRFLPVEQTAARFPEWARAGVKSIMFCGDGEPFLNPGTPRLAIAAKEAGIDISFSTNGRLLTPDKAELVLPVASWIKISCAAATAETYAAIHRTSPDDFGHVLRNLEAAVSLRARHGYGCTLGMQMLLLPENRAEAVTLARKAASIGVDYLIIKPYMKIWQRDPAKQRDISYDDVDELVADLAECSTDHFQVIFRREAMRHTAEQSPPYPHCLALPFAMEVDTAGDIWGCGRNPGLPNFYFGNFLTQSVDEILYSEETAKKRANIEKNHDISQCYSCCRLDIINRYLWELRCPGPHDNFI